MTFGIVMAVSPPIEETQDADIGIFQWAREKRLWIHLSAFLMFSFLIHGAGFYLFKVVYPSPVRIESSPSSVTLMDTSDPAVRLLLQRVSDRTVFLFPPSLHTNARVQLESHPVRFTPAFQRMQLEVRPLPAPTDPDVLLDSGPAGLPSQGDATFKLALRREGALKQREIAPWSIMRDYLRLAEGLPPFRMKIEAEPSGTVRVLDVESEIGESDAEDLSRVVESTLRFLPEAKATTGWISIRVRE